MRSGFLANDAGEQAVAGAAVETAVAVELKGAGFSCRRHGDAIAVARIGAAMPILTADHSERHLIAAREVEDGEPLACIALAVFPRKSALAAAGAQRSRQQKRRAAQHHIPEHHFSHRSFPHFPVKAKYYAGRALNNQAQHPDKVLRWEDITNN